MDKSAITMTADDDWWLERVTMGGEQRYPERIRVGSLERPRVYVPERTCRNASLDPLDFKCSECGAEDYVDGGTIVWVDGGPQDASYCPHCGARIVEVSDDDRR